jgi:hypothetical protein
MTAPHYAVLITRRGDGVELCIKELLVYARAATFDDAYQKLLERKADVLEWTRTLGLVDRLPPPRVPPAVVAALFTDGAADRG